MTHGFNVDEYRALLTANAPRPIETETDLLSLEKQIWDLLAVDERTPAQEAYLTLLSGLVERWESEHVAVPAMHGVELVKALVARATTAPKGSGAGVRNRIDCVRGPLGQARAAGEAHRGIGCLLPRFASCILRSACAASALTLPRHTCAPPYSAVPN